MAGNFDDIIRSVMSLPSPDRLWTEELNDTSPIAAMQAGARVPEDVNSDAGPVTMGHWIEPINAVEGATDVGNETTSPVDPTRMHENVQLRDFQRQAAGTSPQYADAMMQAIIRRQQLGRSE